ncbi:30S ribosomal protein S7 [Candidatus Pacearchaeota archaeon]|nr:30S ribosomal protein S7 [Candidatus Pacearchaeota archaeon]MAG38324.1 30S ribosomal protein S7 [Candidatus Pacearchaeota archaeon]|tara:strand:- start:147 stop:788 length:642 start_codon:yes stop_codon:yes gene_type:complete
MAEQEIQMEEGNNEGEGNFKIFDLYDAENIEIKDPALVPYINLSGKLLVKSQGRNVEKFGKVRVNIIERLANRLAVPGHIGKKHKIITSWASGKYSRNMKTVMQAFEIIAKKTNKNPLQVLVTAIENGSPRDEITIIEHAGARYPQSVDASPLRRVDLAIRWIVQGSYQRCFGKKKKMFESLADEIIKASEGNMESFSVQKRNDSEKQADSAR